MDQYRGNRPAASPPAGFRLDRRQFLGLTATALLLAGCQNDPPQPQPQPQQTTTAPQPGGVITIDALFGASPFYIAHRGSGDNWPEHTMEAYTQSVGAGAQAIEVSVNATRDGVLVCHHDKTLDRTSGTSGTISEMTWAELADTRIDARRWLGPSVAPQPLVKLTDVLDAFAATRVIFIEDKQGTNTTALLDTMDGYPNSADHFVWKQWGGASQHRAAAERGYRTWGYMGPELFDDLDAAADRFDYLGIPHTATDAEVARIVAYGKPVIAWEIHYRWMRDRLTALGVEGMMCSNIPYVMGQLEPAPLDQFESGIRAAGDLPWTTDQGWETQPVFAPNTASIALASAEVQSYLMGSMCPVDGSAYRLHSEMCWPDQVPSGEQHAGLAFGAADDRPYRVREVSESAGYHVILRATGSLELFRRAAGVRDGTRLGTVATEPPRPGEWVRLEIEVSPGTVTVHRLDGVGWTFAVRDETYRGGYFWLCKNYESGPTVAFRALQLVAPDSPT